MKNSIKELISELKSLDPLAVIAYSHFLRSSNKEDTKEAFFSGEELFEILESKHVQLLDQNTRKHFLTIFHFTIVHTKEPDKLLESFGNFINKLTETSNLHAEAYETLIFDILHQFLVSFGTLNYTTKYEIPNFKIINVYSESKTTRLKSRVCVELIVNLTRNTDLLLELLDYENLYFAEFLTHFIRILLKENKLFECEKFWVTCLHNLLNENRKLAVYWLNNALKEIESSAIDNFEVSDFFKWERNSNILNSWYMFLAAIQSLDGKQSYLILPSLEFLNNFKLYGIWNEFIACELMKNSNVLVSKWATRFVLNNYDCGDFHLLDRYLNRDQDSLKLVMEGFNKTFLYSGSNCLTAQDFKTFIRKNVVQFFDVFVSVDWKTIPLFVIFQALNDDILKQYYSNTCSSVEKETKEYKFRDVQNIFNLAGMIRRTENKTIRICMRTSFFLYFDQFIKQMDEDNFFKLLDVSFNENEEKFLSDFWSGVVLESLLTRFDISKSNISLRVYRLLLSSRGSLSHVIYTKIEDNLLKTCSVENLLQLLPFVDDRLAELVCKAISSDIQKLDNTVDKNFLQIYLQLFLANTENDLEKRTRTISEARDIIENDFKGIGKNQLQIETNFSILKQIFVDKLSQLIFLKYECDVEKELNMSQSNWAALTCLDSQVIREIKQDLEFFLTKGSFRTLQQLLSSKNLSKVLFCYDLNKSRKEFNQQLFKTISLEILTSSRKYGFKNVVKSLTNFIKFVATEHPQVLDSILDIDPTNSDYHSLVFSVLLEDEVLSNDNIKFYLTSEEGFIFITKGLFYGEQLLGEPRMEFEHFVHTNMRSSSVTPVEIRKMAVNIIEKFIMNGLETQKILFLRDHLLNVIEYLNKKKSRYFKNSKYHRLNLRISQALAYISGLANLSKEIEWTDRYLKPIFEENNQTDVTYIFELLIAKTISIEKLIQLLQNIQNFKNSSIISLFAISYIACFNFCKDLKSIEQIVKLILPWTMGQNFHIRLYAQITLFHLIKKFELQQYNFMLVSILESLKQGTAQKNYKKLNYDFRFREPNITTLLEQDVLYYCIPHLNQTDIDEYYCATIENKYKDFFKDFLEENEIKAPEETVKIEVDNVQRKINPIVQEEVIFSSYYEETQSKKEMEVDMIVIASLIDKIPNLGGIARTCEVLGIKKLALSSLKYTETKEFKALSMTAEKWLDLFELKEINVQNYLLEMKANGYQIIGAEQTASSENFINFKFPAKSILLLGHEKEGIPANLIAFLEYAVEIPQFGIVRSLNVHVTGALFMWEFCKQHIANK